MAKISRTVQARSDARAIVWQLEQLATRSQQAYDEAVIVHDNGVNLACLICDGYISQVSESGASLLAYTTKILATALEHGITLMLAPFIANETVIMSDAEPFVTQRKNMHGTSVYVTDEMGRDGHWLSLLWASKTTTIVG